MIKDYTCILCPAGCNMTVDFNEKTKLISTVEGASCDKGEGYVIQELTDPQRTIQTSIKIIGGELPLASVKTTRAIPKNRIMDVMNIIKGLEIKAPVKYGDIVKSNVLGLGTDIVITKTIKGR